MLAAFDLCKNANGAGEDEYVIQEVHGDVVDPNVLCETTWNQLMLVENQMTEFEGETILCTRPLVVLDRGEEFNSVDVGNLVGGPGEVTPERFVLNAYSSHMGVWREMRYFLIGLSIN